MADEIMSSVEGQTVRQNLAYEASHQIAALSQFAMSEILRINVAGDDGVRAAIIRIHDLSLATMSAMGDDSHDEADLRETVHGRVAAAMRAKV